MNARAVSVVVVAVCSLGLRASTADDALVKLVAQVKPAVVAIRTSDASGSGYIVADDMVVTNYHVIEGADTATIKRVDGLTIAARGVKFLDPKYDIAILDVPGIAKDIQPLKLSESLPPQGKDVLAVGNPLGFEFSVTKGIVSAVRSAESMKRILPGIELSGTWIQTDVAISPGNSGGPLLLMTGEVVGMNTFTRRESQNLNFAISAQDIRVAIEKAAQQPVRPLQAATAKSAVKNENSDEKITGLLVKSLAPIVSKLPAAKLSRLTDVDADKIRDLLDPLAIQAVDEGSVARVRGVATLVQVLPDSVLVLIDGAICMVFTFRGAEIGAKTGGRVGTQIPVDDVFIVGKATPYRTVAGDTKFAIPLIPLLDLKPEYWKEPIEKIVQAELAKQQDERAAKLARAAELSLARLRRTFTDASGSYKVDAAAVAFDGESVTLVRMESRKTIQVPIAKLSQADRAWIEKNKAWIKIKGPKLQDHLTAAQNTKQNTDGNR